MFAAFLSVQGTGQIGTYVGCYTDTKYVQQNCEYSQEFEPGRDLNGTACWTTTNGAPPMTLEVCYQHCAGYKYYGTQYADQCFCGNAYGTKGNTLTSDACYTKCVGNTTQYCGDTQHNSVWART